MRHMEQTGCRGMVSPAWAVDPTPLPSPIQSGCDLLEVHTHAKKMFSEFRVKTGQVMLLSTELQ